MNRQLLKLIPVLALAFGITLIFTFLIGCSDQHASSPSTGEQQLYTCGMHPQVIQNKPGNCPICGAALVPK